MVDASRVSSAGPDAGNLATRYEGLAASIMETERAWQADGLTDAAVAHLEALLQPTYAQLAVANRRPLSFRLRAVTAILDRARHLANATRLVVDARVKHPPRPAASLESAGAPTPTLSVDTADGPVDCPFLNVFDSRFWGIDVRPADDDARVNYREAVWRKLVSGLVSDLKSLGVIENRFRLRDVDADMQLLADRRAEAFERLIVDILRAEGLYARSAPLDEDFLEKTDLRVRVPGLERNRGARVQVTLITNADRLRDKVARIRVADELVLLSPRTLAEALCGRPDGTVLDQEEANAALRVLGVEPTGSDRAATSLLTLFLDALHRLGDDVRGPVALIPPPVRRLVGRFVTSEALRSTQALRVRESGRRRTRETNPDETAGQFTPVDGPAVGRVDELFDHADQQHPVGSHAVGRVVSLSRHGAVLVLDSGLQAFLHNNEVSWTDQNLKASDRFAVGDSVEVVIQSIDSERRRISASHRLAVENPWLSLAEQFPVNAETEGQVASVVKYGLFVKLPNHCVGLLHVSKLSAAIETYAVGASITVRVVDFDPDKRRVSLAEAPNQDAQQCAPADRLASAPL